jgi:hypothetical protein
MPIRLPQVAGFALGYNASSFRLPSDSVGVSAFFRYEPACTEHLECVSVVFAARGGNTDFYKDLHEDALAHTKSCGIKRTCANRIGMK